MLTAMLMKTKVLCDMTPYWLVSSYRCLAGTCCRHLQYPSPGTPYYLDPEGGSSKFLQKIDKDLPIDMVSHPRKLVYSSLDFSKCDPLAHCV
jgi:hypothetical protein